MTLQERVRDDMIKSMKARTVEKTGILRVALGEFARKGKELSDEVTIGLIRKLVSNATDLNNDKEIEILSIYLPKMLEPKDIKVIVTNIIEVNSLSGAQNIGRAMGLLKKCKEFSLIDMKTASQIVKELLTT